MNEYFYIDNKIMSDFYGQDILDTSDLEKQKFLENLKKTTEVSATNLNEKMEKERERLELEMIDGLSEETI